VAIPTEGQKAPEFTALDDRDQEVSLSAFKGRVVVLFFYPKDDTPGCTTEACSFRDALPRFEGLDAVILGVSPDSTKSHRKFKEKFKLPYTLISDTGHRIAEQYGVWGEKTIFGRKYLGVLRTTFVIDQDGRIAKVFEKVKPEEHAQAVAAAVGDLAAK
jgi:thioredoxin-dependent peroxiredoxin